ncbi:response regulator [Pseudobacteriovorax antillogorgiicola]|uniref:Two-component system, OmpR family, phosphate regulon response regulator PhoB/two-component system, OmpR family, alkaline phosphatase synthesis response regulator PhoP n=1 Tax=Pseudobacteriovorax antillogorgiicola TaxID=1513793 RepID=A0A1Y6CN81_9BACT|nr:response regulator [Pseudobacteriovorax antillogorgiicola]TCS44412.1 two-component system phosphate regulon response regulator PhoB/two-component system alkaline phosphatase synthesis response regulator PhoP [Pseudobacteriovorax antillogorgiicola]SMF79161.1 two-component system, OmpR family, phosphate regulon response regulator PhoB/two-component system, OmpR family, alkaline phosphatase synthesis response regulator PhoP [Pseudobacteriovorax antillogorgiicola]
MKRLLVVEDDPDIRELLRYNLTREGFEVLQANNGAEGLKMATSEAVDLIILDLMLPQLSGIEVCKKLRELPNTKSVPVIMLTAKGEETDIVFGLGVGADDYMVKPFSVKELVARVYTRLRTIKAEEREEADVIRQGAVEVDRARFQVKVDGGQIPMTLAEFRLFNALISRPGIVLSRDRLLDAVTGGDGVLIDRNIDVHVRSIRKKLGESRDLIQTVRGLGYKFKEL